MCDEVDILRYLLNFESVELTGSLKSFDGIAHDLRQINPRYVQSQWSRKVKQTLNDALALTCLIFDNVEVTGLYFGRLL